MLRLVVLAAVLVGSRGAPRTYLSRPQLDGRIVGGDEASIEDFPYQLSLERSGSHICGASIISANYALTAAHCAVVTTVSTTTLRAGSSTRGTGGTVHGAVQITVHPDFNGTTYESDVAVIKVSTPFPITPTSQIIPLATSAPAIGTRVTTSGWGATVSGGIGSPLVLRSVQLSIIGQDECFAAYAEEGGVSENMICAGDQAGGKDSCNGDSGGPLVANGELVGVVSFGIGCGSPAYPGVYANVASLREWIVKNAQE